MEDLYFTKAEIEYHLYNIKMSIDSKFKKSETTTYFRDYQLQQVEQAQKKLRTDSTTVDFVLLVNPSQKSSDTHRIVFTRLAPLVYTPHRIAHEMVRNNFPISVELFEKKLEQIKKDWENLTSI